MIAYPRNSLAKSRLISSLSIDDKVLSIAAIGRGSSHSIHILGKISQSCNKNRRIFSQISLEGVSLRRHTCFTSISIANYYYEAQFDVFSIHSLSFLIHQ